MSSVDALSSAKERRLSRSLIEIRSGLAKGVLSVRGRLILLTVAMVIPLTVLSGASIWHAYATEHAQDEVELIGRAQAAATMIDREFESSLAALRILGSSKALLDGDLNGFDGEMRRAGRALGGALINLTAPSGQITRSTLWPVDSPTLEKRANNFVLGALRANQAGASNLFVGLQTGKPTIAIALPVTLGASEAPTWILTLYPPTGKIAEKLGDLKLPPTTNVSIVDRDDTIIARNRDAANFVGKTPPADMRAALAAHSAGLLKSDHRARNGLPTVAAYARAPVSGYAAIVGIPVSDFDNPVRTTLTWAGGIATALAALGLGGALYASRDIARALQQLTLSPPGTAPVTGFREIDEVGRALAKLEAGRRESEVRLELATEAGNIGIWDRNILDGSYVCSIRTRAIFGFTVDENVTYDMILAATYPDDQKKTDHSREQSYSFETQARGPFEYRIVQRGGAIRWVVVHGHAIVGTVDRADRVVRYVGTIQDITDRKTAEQVLLESQARLHLAMDAGRMAIWEHDAQSCDITPSPGICSLLGFAVNAVPTQAEVRARWALGERERCALEIQDARMGDGRYYEGEHRFIWPDGSSHWLMLRAEFQPGSRKSEPLIGVAMDVTQRKMTEEKILENDAILRELLATIDLAPVFVRAWNGPIRFWSRGCEVLYGWTAAEAVGRDPQSLLKTVNAIPQSEIDAHLLSQGEWQGDVRHFRQDDVPLTISLHLALQPSETKEEPNVLVNVRDVTALRDAEEKLRALNLSLETRVRTEIAARELAQARAARAERLQALGQLAGGIAHDFNNILQIIGNATSLVEIWLRQPERMPRVVTTLQRAVERGAAVTRRLLLFARRSDLKAEPIHPLELFEAMRDMLNPTLGGTAQVAVDVDADTRWFLADRLQLETMLVNLVTNARDAMPNGGFISLRARTHDVADDNLADLALLKRGRYVALTVSDTGTGMDESVIERAIEPFFSTKAPEAGTGLGLSMAHAFAQQSHGHLQIESAVGRGTDVTVWLPITGDPTAAASPVDVQSTRHQPPFTRVLVVDDDADVREILVAGLTEMGLSVRGTNSGAAAMGMFSDGQTFDCMVTDLSMPGMNGVDLVRAIRHIQPDLPAIVLTGYAAHEALGDADAEMPYLVMWKPANVARIAERISEIVIKT
jgi:PAS domain S-box-containing protein